jgi:hypothetical protein
VADNAEFVGESPRSRFGRDLAIESVRQKGETTRQGTINRTNIQSKYIQAMVEKDKTDYETALKLYQDLGNLPAKQQEMFKQTEGFKQMQKVWKRVQLPVFDDNGEVVMPSSKADAQVESRRMIEEIVEDIRSKRKPNEATLGTVIGALSNRADTTDDDAERASLGKLIKFFESQLGAKAGVEMEDAEDPAGLNKYMQGLQ